MVSETRLVIIVGLILTLKSLHTQSVKGLLLVGLFLQLLCGYSSPSTSPYSLGLGSFELLDAEHVSFDIWKTRDRRDPYQPEYNGKWDNGAQFNLGLRVLELLKWDSRLHMDSAEGVLRNVGWEWKVSMDYFHYVVPFYLHHSQHSLDAGETGRFPLVDQYGLSFVFLDKPRK